MLKVKKILFSILVIFLFNNNEAFSLPENNSDNEWNWLKNNPFLVYDQCVGCVSFYKYLNNNRILTFMYEDNKNIVEKEIISIFGNKDCRSFADLNELYKDLDLNCIENIKDNGFVDNKTPKLINALKSIYNDELLIKDVENAKLYKKGYRYFYIEFLDPTSSNSNRVKLDYPIEQKIYLGKKYDYIIMNYRVEILKKNLFDGYFQDKKYIDIVTKYWEEDLILKSKIDEQFNLRKLEENKKKEFNLD